MGRHFSRRFWWSEYQFLILSILLYSSIALFSVNKALTMDQAIPVAANGGAIAIQGFNALGNTDKYYEIAHPPFHQHLLAISFLIFGETTIAARLVGLICTIGILILIFQFARMVKDKRRRCGVFNIQKRKTISLSFQTKRFSCYLISLI